MKLEQVLEAIREEAVLKIFSTLVTAVNNMADVVGTDGLSGDDATSTLSELQGQLQASNDRIARLEIDQPTWESMSSSMQFGKDTPKTWQIARAFITRRLIPEIIASVGLVLKQPYGPDSKATFTMLKERILNAQTFLVGVAPVGQAAANAVDEVPEVPQEIPDDAEAPAKEEEPEKK